MYTDLYIKKSGSKRLFKILAAILAISTAVGVGVYTLTGSPSTRASESDVKTHEIVNVSHTQFGVFWMTGSANVGYIIYGTAPDKLINRASDELDSRGITASTRSHLAIARNLSAGTQYFYAIMSGSRMITGEDGKPFSFTTPKLPSTGGYSKPAYGRVTTESGLPVDTSIVILRKKNAYPLAVRTKKTGEWLIPLQQAYDSRTNEPIAFGKNEEVTIDVYDAALRASRVSALTAFISPLPKPIVIGRNYTFREEGLVLPASTSRASLPVSLGVDVTFPKEGAVIPGSTPLIKGTADPGTRVIVSIDTSPEVRVNTLTDARGVWQATLAKPLLPGSYTLTVRARQQSGGEIVRVRTFTIAKSGEIVLGTATGSARLSPTITVQPAELSPTTPRLPTAEPTPSQAAVPSQPLPTYGPPSPTAAEPAKAEPTKRPHASAALSPNPTEPTVVTAITATPMPPVSGRNGLLFSGISIGLLIVGAGALLFL